MIGLRRPRQILGQTDAIWRPRTFSDWLFMLVAPSAAVGSAFGSVTVLGVALYPFKVLVLVLVAVVLSQRRRTSATAIPIIWASLVLAVWALTTVTWSPAGSKALQEATIFVFLVGLLLVALKAIGMNWFPSLIFGWPIAVFLTGVVSIWELATGSHLKSVFVAEHGGDLWTVPLSTFGNPNNYGAFLALAVAVCAVALGMDSFGRRARVVIGGAILLALVLLPITASRLAVLGLLGGLFSYATLVLPARRGQRFMLILAAVALPAIMFALRASPDLAAKFSSVAAVRSGSGNSTSIRENLILNGVDFFVGSRGIGIGAAGYESLVLSGDFRHSLYGRAVNPHNMWIEILSEYGLAGILSIVLILGFALRAAGPLRYPSWFGAAYIAALVTYLIAAMTASSYVNDAVSWTYFSTFVALGVWADWARRRTAS